MVDCTELSFVFVFCRDWVRCLVGSSGVMVMVMRFRCRLLLDTLM